jgi:hypothetical protein
MADTETLAPEVEAVARERVNGILHSQLAASLEAVPDAPQAPPARRPRSDKGIPRKQPAAPPTPSGAFTETNAKAILDLAKDVEFAAKCVTQTVGALDRAEANLENANKRLADYLDSLTAKGGKA